MEPLDLFEYSADYAIEFSSLYRACSVWVMQLRGGLYGGASILLVHLVD